jgi:hypothetical protein
MTRYSRRTVLRGVGAAAVLGSGLGSASASTEQDLRLVGDANLAADTPDGYGADGCYDLGVKNDVALAADWEGVTAVDLRNRADPTIVARRDTPGTYCWDAKVDGDVLAVASQLDEEIRYGEPWGDGDPDEIGVTVYDASDPTAPVEGGHISLLPLGSHNVYVEDGFLYVVHQWVAAADSEELDYRFFLKIYDVSDPSTPEKLSEYAPEVPGYTIHDVYVQDDLAYLPSFQAGLRVLDVSDPTDPVEVGVWESPTGRAHYAQPTPDGDVTFVGDEIFSEPYGGVHVLDTSDLSAIERIAFIAPPESGGIPTAHNFDVSANRLDVGWDSAGVLQFDVADPANPERVARYDPGGFWWGAVQEDGFTLGSDAASGALALLSTDNGTKRAPAGEVSEITEAEGHGARGHPRPKRD